MYADTDLWVALLKDDDSLAERAEEVLKEHGDELEVSLVTFVELFLIEERYSFERERAVTSILELASFDGDEDVPYQASEYVDDGLNTFDAFHAALADDSIVSSDKAFEGIGVERLPLEPDDQQ
jgi:predicted nucleic acid-binding protein